MLIITTEKKKERDFAKYNSNSKIIYKTSCNIKTLPPYQKKKKKRKGLNR